ncbi:MAG: hypothetical protein U0L09_07265 [Christensenellales bacterium]|nr:hypothetical protein [Christensenellales bacterium]
MKKWMLFVLSLTIMTVQGVEAEELHTVRGRIVEIQDEIILIQSEDGTLNTIKQNKETVFEGVKAEMLEEGQGVIVDIVPAESDGVEAPMLATRIGVFAYFGTVVRASKGELVLSEHGTGEELHVTIPPESPELVPGCVVTVYSDGVASASLPSRINSILVLPEQIRGFIGAVENGEIRLIDQLGREVWVQIPEDTVVRGEMVEGVFVTVYTEGATTMSLPARTTAVAVIEEKVERITGIITGMEEAALVIDSVGIGPVSVRIRDDCRGDALPWTLGQRVEVAYNGMMTRSIPGQITAEGIRTVS